MVQTPQNDTQFSKKNPKKQTFFRIFNGFNTIARRWQPTSLAV